jgi:hypothetical protein
MIEVQCYISAFTFYLSPLLITFADQILLEK